MSDLDGFEELARKMPARMRARFLAGLAPEDRLAGLAPEDRLAGLAPEDRLADLTADQAILALPDATLARLPAEFIDQLPDDVRSAVRKRLAALR